MKKSVWIIAAAAAVPAWLAADTCNNDSMTARQSILKRLYPVLTGITRMTGSKTATYRPEKPLTPSVPFHSLTMTSIEGTPIPLASMKGKMVMLVNTASDCGYTAQYEALQQLQDRYRDRLVVIGFPSNDFKQQEKGDNAQIAAFCKRNYGVTFPLAEKSSVLKGPVQNPVFTWLSDSRSNGWNERQPVWNFSKYLVDSEGRLLAVFEPSVDPTSPDVISLIEKAG